MCINIYLYIYIYIYMGGGRRPRHGKRERKQEEHWLATDGFFFREYTTGDGPALNVFRQAV